MLVLKNVKRIKGGRKLSKFGLSTPFLSHREDTISESRFPGPCSYNLPTPTVACFPETDK